jgi:hypothetical protein
MRSFLLAALMVLPAIAGCAGIDAAREYDDVQVTSFDANGHPWRIFDKPEEGRLMITPSFGRSAGAGLWRGLTFGAVDGSPPKPEFQSAVEAYLASHRPTKCTVLDGYVLLSPQWEFKYRC